MSLITRCPACGTMFKVVTDQLKVSQGWVRCGQCAEVFDAQLHLQAQLASTTATPSTSAPSFDVLMATPFGDGHAAGAYEQDVIAALQLPSLTSPRVAPVDEHANSLVAQPAQDTLEPIKDTNSDDGQVLDHASASALDGVSFVRDARRKAFWRKPLVRSLLVLFAVSLACLLAVQAVVQQRNAILAFEPRSKPWLQLLCDHLACDVGVPRRIEAIVIDSSSFNKADGIGSYRLSFSLKNSSTSVVAMPSLEVSLTDGQDQAIIRRVLSPSQFGAANGMLAASSDFSTAVALQVQSGSPALRIAGYRLLAFYP